MFADTGLLGLIRLEHFDEVCLGEILEAVTVALEQLPEDSPQRPWLLEIEEGLRQDQDLRPQLRAFAQAVLEGADTPVQALERELIQLAHRLEESEWSNERYQEFGRYFEDSEYLDELESSLGLVAQQYEQLHLLPGELTAETLVGDRLMRLSLECWQLAVDHARHRDRDEALAQAQDASRAQAVLERLHMRARTAALPGR